jgi:hypothetical protein
LKKGNKEGREIPEKQQLHFNVMKWRKGQKVGDHYLCGDG